ncbi:MAG TPA: tRNA pseudouridine(38-40) synthase TruA [Terracidiphilus sp.]
MTELAQLAAHYWKLTLAYDGSDFAGWQIQPGQLTIQAEIQAALGRICGETPLPQGSGRTDAGVHALGQVCSFALVAPIPADNLQRALNKTLPAAIRILGAKAVRSSFHARHAALAKTYEYRIYRDAICPPTLARFVHACTWRLDRALLDEAAAAVVGTHDFVSFAAARADATGREGEVAAVSAAPPDKQGTTRTIFSSTWSERETGLLVYTVRGNGFLHHMVRNLVGTMLEIGRGQFAPGSMATILAARNRSAAGPTSPAKGLFLHSVEYGEADAAVEQPEDDEQ